MSKNIENIDRYLKSVIPPEHVSHAHRLQLRREVLGRIERRPTMSTKIRTWKYAAVIALICTGIAAATVVGVKIHKWYFVEKDPQYGYMLRSEDGRYMTNVPDSWADNPEHAVEVREELDLLKQQDKRELVSATEYKVNGQHDHWWLTYEYTLSDGRVIRKGEYDPDDNTPRILSGDLHKEAHQRFRDEILKDEYLILTTDPETGEKLKVITPSEGVVLNIYDQAVHGKVFTFHSRQFSLDDGTTVTFAFGRLSEDNPDATRTVVSGSDEAGQAGNDLQEIAILRQQASRKLIAVDDLVASGELDRRVFVYQYQLSDGRTMDMREGDELNLVRNKKLRGDEINFILNEEQREEWVQLRDAGFGEDIDTYEEEFEGQLFVFERKKFVLSDGTEVIWSYGTLKNDP